MELYEEKKEKDKKIEDLMLIKSKFPFELTKNDKLMSVIFVSVDQVVHYSVICKNSDIFIRIETLLYEEYPIYKESENYFIYNGYKINKYKILEENKIKNSGIITLEKIN